MENIRLQKYLADCGVASRRKCEELISNGVVFVNGVKITELGVKVAGNEEITVNGNVVKPVSKKIYLLMNKPAGYVTSVSDNVGRPVVTDLLKDEIHTRVYPVGRLDFETEGLLLLTNDGDLAQSLTHPRHNVEKKYIAEIDAVPHPAALERIRRGVVIDGVKTRPAKVNWIRDNVVEVVICEGRNRQIRKMFESVKYEVKYLKRVAIGNIILGNLPLGRFRHLNPNEIKYLKSL